MVCSQPNTCFLSWGRQAHLTHHPSSGSRVTGRSRLQARQVARGAVSPHMQGPDTSPLPARLKSDSRRVGSAGRATWRECTAAASRRAEGGRSLGGRPEEPRVAGDSWERMGTGRELCCFHRMVWAGSRDGQTHCGDQKHSTEDGNRSTRPDDNMVKSHSPHQRDGASSPKPGFSSGPSPCRPRHLAVPTALLRGRDLGSQQSVRPSSCREPALRPAPRARDHLPASRLHTPHFQGRTSHAGWRSGPPLLVPMPAPQDRTGHAACAPLRSTLPTASPPGMSPVT